MYYTYILKSRKNNKYYIGYTSDIKKRLGYHNAKKVLATKNSVPWELFHVEEYIMEAEAISRERRIKNWKSRKAIEGLKF